MSTKSPNNKTYTRPLLVGGLMLPSLIWIFSVFVVNPVGNFPLADDLGYGATVKHLLGTGEYEPQGVVQAPMITNILWGALFCLPAGFSFTALRVSTLVASLAGIFATYFVIQKLTKNLDYASLGALSLATNPTYLGTSFTFDTDVLFVTILTVSIFLYIRALSSEAYLSYVSAIVLSILATLSRQIAVVIPVAYLVTSLCRPGRTYKAVVRSIAPTLACASAYLIFRAVMLHEGKIPTFTEWHTQLILNSIRHPASMMRILPNHLAVCTAYLGLFSFPAAFPFFSVGPYCRDRKRASRLLISGLAILLLVGMFLTRPPNSEHPDLDDLTSAGTFRPLVPVGDFLNVWGIGWPSALLSRQPPGMLMLFWAIIMALGTIAGAALIIYIINSLRHYVRDLRSSESQREFLSSNFRNIFLLLSVVFYCIPLLLGNIWDRYFIPLIPILVMLFASEIEGVTAVTPFLRPKWVTTASVGLSLLIGAASIASTRDFLMYNRVNWDALQELMIKDHVPSGNIEGGYEFDWFYSSNIPPWTPARHAELTLMVRKQHRDTYIASTTEQADYDVLRRYSYFQWLPPRNQTVFVLHKRAGN